MFEYVRCINMSATTNSAVQNIRNHSGRKFITCHSLRGVPWPCYAISGVAYTAYLVEYISNFVRQ